jgi:hypothetical protein
MLQICQFQSGICLKITRLDLLPLTQHPQATDPILCSIPHAAEFLPANAAPVVQTSKIQQDVTAMGKQLTRPISTIDLDLYPDSEVARANCI